MSNTGGVDEEGQDDKAEEIGRRDHRDKGDRTTEDANDDGLQNDDEVDEVNEQAKNDSHLEGGRQKRIIRSNNPWKSFDERLEALKVFREKHGHVRVTVKHDKSLGWFCTNMRSAGRGKGNMTITEDRIKALNELGFEWAPCT